MIQPENPELTFTEEVKEEEIKFNVVEELDSSLKEGERVVKTKGVVGRKKLKATIFKADGKEVGRVVDSEEVLTKAIDEVVLVGTKKEVSPILPEQLSPRKEVKDEKNDSKPVVSDDANKLPTTGMKDSKASIVLAIIAATTSLGLVARKKEDK